MMDKFLKLRDVTEMTGISKTEIYRRMAKSAFPKQYKLGDHCARWKQSEIQAWIEQQVNHG